MSRSIVFSKSVLSVLGLSVAVMAACSAPEAQPADPDKEDPGLVIDDPNASNDVDVTTLPPTDGCGDGTLDDDEACDDGNLESGDGCGSNCRYIEASYICPDEGQPCRAYAKCGDGLVIFPEQCDDGGVEPGDGCSATCKVEVGYRCDGESPSSCTETVCGDNVMEGSETCDDGNTMPFDGCSPSCQAEPSCTTDGCTSSCGDGVVVGDEECDDGNLVNGDGCSDACTVEDGYMCPQGDPCEDINGECGLTLPIIFRDFSTAHSDFQVECGELVLGLVDETLVNGKPVANGSADLGKACIASASSLKQWYTDNDLNYTVPGEIVLFRNAAGAYVNRLSDTGSQFFHPAGTFWCADDASVSDCNACDPGYTTCQDPCTGFWGAGNNQVCANFATATPVDGNPLFFPLDTLPGAPFLSAGQLSAASIPGPVYGGGNAGSTPHNFHFTSEVVHWFQYKKGEELNLAFNGDDDVWVYINNHLAVDLGGLHEPVEGKFELAADGTVTLTTATKPVATVTTKSIDDYGMKDGGVYEIKVFHAERKTSGSSFKLTLSGFNTARSDCSAVCGDGILAAGEQCDDGKDANVGGHNRCNSDCTLGAYCGDGIKQDEEECDDNDPNAPNSCNGCRIVIIR